MRYASLAVCALAVGISASGANAETMKFEQDESDSFTATAACSSADTRKWANNNCIGIAKRRADALGPPWKVLGHTIEKLTEDRSNAGYTPGGKCSVKYTVTCGVTLTKQ